MKPHREIIKNMLSNRQMYAKETPVGVTHP